MFEEISTLQIKSSLGRQRAVFWVFRLATYAILLVATWIFADILIKGGMTVFRDRFPFVNVEFLTESPQTLYVFEYEGQKLELSASNYQKWEAAHPGVEVSAESVSYSGGGIFPCIVGTVLLVAGSMTIALTLGICSAVYLSEYSKRGTVLNLIRLAIMNLAGVPSIVFGLFGVGLFVVFMKWNVSLIAGWFTLAFMVLPVIITASEESLRAVPKEFREGALALGATQWQAIRKNVLPYALPGMLTSSILGIARVAGETAPIMFTAAYATCDLPWEKLEHWYDFFFRGVMALPYHIYVVSTKVPPNIYTHRMQYGTSFVFLVIVLSIALASVLLRQKVRAGLKW